MNRALSLAISAGFALATVSLAISGAPVRAEEKSCVDARAQQTVPAPLSPFDLQFAADALPGNSIDFIGDGGTAIAAKLQALREANGYYYLTAYAWEDDDTGRRFLSAVCARGKQIDVRLLLDAFACKQIVKYQMWLERKCGVRVIFFNPGTLWRSKALLGVLHSKMVATDRVYILGGSGYSKAYGRFDPKKKAWEGYGPDDEFWYDHDYRLRGPVVCKAQKDFLELWGAAAEQDKGTDFSEVMGSGESTRDEQAYWKWKYHPGKPPDCRAGPAGDSRILVLENDPVLSSARPTGKAYRAAIESTVKGDRIAIYSPYPYCLDPAAKSALIAAAGRGVRVDLLTNSRTSTDESKAMATAAYLETRELRQAGVNVYLWPLKNLMHRKGGVIGKWSYGGSDNFNKRGQDTEAENVFFTDDAEARRKELADFDRDIWGLRPVKDEDLDKEYRTLSGIERFEAKFLKKYCP